MKSGKFAHYELLDCLGKGAMGTVYRAFDTRLERTVALKLLTPSGDPERRRRFLREARTASALEHTNIVRVYEIGTAAEYDYIAMEYVGGETLDRLIPSGGMVVNSALSYAMQIADALACAHTAGVIHRDLKPQNIIVDGRGHAKLVDFGLAKILGAHAVGLPTADAQTETGTVLGTIPYMSPEQARGEDLDERSDLFALGVILYEMLTGTRAFAGCTPAATYDAILNRDPTPPRSLRQDVSPELERIVARSLEKDRARRYGSASELREDLARLVTISSGAWVPAADATVVLPGPRQRRLWPVIALSLVAASILAALWQANLHLQRSRDGPASARPLTSFPGGEYEPAFSPDGRMFAFVWGGEHNNNFDIYIQVIDVGSPQRLTRKPSGEGSPAWSPDGRHIAFVRYSAEPEESGVYVAPAFGGDDRKIASLSRLPHIFDRHLDWAPDGRSLAVVDRTSAEAPFCLYAVSLSGGALKRLTAPALGTLGDTGPAFSPDGRRIAFRRTENAGTNDLYVMPASGGEPRRLTFDRSFTSGHAWTQDGQDIVFTSRRTGSISLWRVRASGGVPQAISGVAEGAYNIAIARTGNRFGYSKYYSDTNVWETDLKSKRKRRLLGSTRNERSAQYSPDRSRIAFRSDRSGADEIWVSEASGENAIRLTSFDGPLTGTPRWSPDGRFIAFDSRPNGNADIYIIGANGGPPRRVTSAAAEDVVPSWSRDGRHLYFASNRSGDWQVWKIESGTSEEAAPPVQLTRKGGFSAFDSPDGKTVFYAKGRNLAGLWRVDTQGGSELLVFDSLMAGYWGNWAVADRGIFFIQPSPPEAAIVLMYSFAEKRIVRVATLERDPPFSDAGFDVSRDGNAIVYSQVDQSGSDILLVERFR